MRPRAPSALARARAKWEAVSARGEPKSQAIARLLRRLGGNALDFVTRRPLRSFAEWRAASDRPSRRRVRQLRAGVGDTPVPIRTRALGGETVYLRPRSTDLVIFLDTFVSGYHLPPPGLRPHLIWDLGANIGLTMAHFAVLYPEARIVGVELDGENAALARRNVGAWSDRCSVLHGAIWPEDGVVFYERAPGNEWGYAVAPHGNESAPAISPTTLLEQTGGPVDFAKVDVEGAERSLLSDGGPWAQQVRAIKVEVHHPWPVEECVAALQRLGFETARAANHAAFVVGRRP